MPYTKEYHQARARAYYHSHRDECLRKNKERYLKRTEKKVRKDTLLRRKWKERSPRTYLWSTAKYRAKKAGLPFNLQLSDVVIPEFCPYLGLRLTSEKGSGRLDNLMSVDRIVPALGYISGNIEVISYKANRMKNDASVEELVIFAKSILNKFVNT